MLNFDSPTLLYELLIVFFLLLFVVLLVLAKAKGKGSVSKFPLFFAAACFILRLMVLEQQSNGLEGGYNFIFLAPAAVLILMGAGEVVVSLFYRLFGIDKKIEEQDGKPPQMKDAPSPNGQHSPLFSNLFADGWNKKAN